MYMRGYNLYTTCEFPYYSVPVFCHLRLTLPIDTILYPLLTRLLVYKPVSDWLEMLPLDSTGLIM